ncbi:MAG: Ig-like domain-containing protein, partial [Candidatus Heimdallarchaeota archaeon]|nr:Ig-like domain-containing protein [Candidatus Heimdallarchaeota archaeon]
MKHFKYLLFSCFLGSFCNLSAQNINPYQFVSPKPDSLMVSNETNIILRYSGIIDRTSLSTSQIMVEGCESGEHAGEFILSDDGRTIVFNPDLTFSGDEEVYVVLTVGIKTRAGDELPDFSFNFSTAPERVVQLPDTALTEYMKAFKKSGTGSFLPAPPITIDSIDDPSPGYIFMATWDRNVPAIYGNYIFVLDKNGAIVDSLRV